MSGLWGAIGLSVWFLIFFFYFFAGVLRSLTGWFADQLTVDTKELNAYFIFANRARRCILTSLKLSVPLGTKCAHRLSLLHMIDIQLDVISLWDFKGKTMFWVTVALLVGVWTALGFNVKRQGNTITVGCQRWAGSNLVQPCSLGVSDVFSVLPCRCPVPAIFAMVSVLGPLHGSCHAAFTCMWISCLWECRAPLTPSLGEKWC